MINVDEGFFVPTNNFFNGANSNYLCRNEYKTPRKMLKKSSRLSFNGTKSPYIISVP